MNAASRPPTKRKKSGESYRRDARLSADGARHPDNPPHGGHGSCVRNSPLARASTTIASNSTSLLRPQGGEDSVDTLGDCRD